MTGMNETPMETEKNVSEPNSQRTTIIVVAIIAAVAIGSLFYLLMRQTSTGDSPQPRLAAALRAGSPDFEKYRAQIVLDEPEAEQANSVLGGLTMTLQTTVRNFTGRTITGLEMRAAVVDHQDQPVKERIFVVIPTRQPELEPNKTLVVPIKLEGMKDEDDRANIRMEVTGLTLR